MLLPVSTGIYRHLPASTSIYRHILKSGRYASTGIYRHLPASTGIYRHNLKSRRYLTDIVRRGVWSHPSIIHPPYLGIPPLPSRPSSPSNIRPFSDIMGTLSKGSQQWVFGSGVPPGNVKEIIWPYIVTRASVVWFEHKNLNMDPIYQTQVIIIHEKKRLNMNEMIWQVMNLNSVAKKTVYPPPPY